MKTNEDQDPDEITPHEETREFRYFGPPGTGKTTTLTRQIGRAAERFGADRVLVTSFTKTAAAELIGRGLAIKRNRVGTIHSHCYRALDSPAIAESNVEEWNKKYPTCRLTPKETGKLDTEDNDGGVAAAHETRGKQPGDLMLERINCYRGWLEDPAVVADVEHKRFWKDWLDYKRACRLIDFTDMVEYCLRDLKIAPDAPAVIFADEAQDLNPLQMKLIRQWGRHTEYFIVAGDDDQLLYDWCGCTPDALLKPALPPEAVRVLAQSYRLPRRVHRVAVNWIEQMRDRQPKNYRPRDAEGDVKRISHHWTGYHQELLSLFTEVIEPHLKIGHSVMLLFSCDYMIDPVRQMLRHEGIPFHNPFRISNGVWNPLRRTAGSSVNRALALMAAHPKIEGREWTRRDLRLISEWMSTEKGFVKRGVKTRLHKMSEPELDQRADEHELIATFDKTTIDQLMTCLGNPPADLGLWWKTRIGNATFSKRAEFPLEVVTRRGRQALIDRPQIVIGTIHSVKGGQADVVVLFPDISSQARYSGGARVGESVGGWAALQRQFYVGMTRAREALYIALPMTRELSVDFSGLGIPLLSGKVEL